MANQKPLSELSIDPTTRPKAPAIDGVTADQRRKGGHLALIHRHHLQEMSRIARVLEAIEAGQSDASTLPNLILSLDMTRNFRAFGNMCGQECRMLTFHHDAEEQMMFPQLEEKGSAGLRAVVMRLREEHLVVHELIDRLHEAAVALVSDPGAQQFAATCDIFKALEQAVRSHFSYEETELAEAIGVHLDFI